jgi:hypothetical protein
MHGLLDPVFQGESADQAAAHVAIAQRTEQATILVHHQGNLGTGFVDPDQGLAQGIGGPDEHVFPALHAPLRSPVS